MSNFFFILKQDKSLPKMIRSVQLIGALCMLLLFSACGDGNLKGLQVSSGMAGLFEFNLEQLTDNDTSDRYPKIRGDRIVWRAEDNDENSTIMMAYIKDASPWILFMPAILSAVETNN